MTVEIKLIPNDRAQIPAELIDHGIVATHLSDVDVPDGAPIDSWRAIERVTPANQQWMALRVRGIMLSDVPDTLLTECHETLTNQVAGVKPHPDGWTEYDGSDGDLPANR